MSDNNIWGSGGSSNGVGGGSSVIVSGTDVVITTLKDKQVLINSGKQNEGTGTGDVIFNRNTSNANVQVENGSMNVLLGDVSGVNVKATNNLKAGANIETPCLITSVDSFNIGTTTSYTTSDINLNIEKAGFAFPQAQIWAASNTGIGSNATVPSTSVFYPAIYEGSPYTAVVTVPANTAGYVQIAIPATTQTTYQWISSGNTIAFAEYINNYVVSGVSYMEANKWYTVTLDDCSIYQGTNAGVYSIVALNIPILCKWVPPVNSGWATTNQVFRADAIGSTTQTYNQSIGSFVYQFICPYSNAIQKYKIFNGAVSTLGAIGTLYAQGQTPMTYANKFMMNFGVTSLSYTISLPANQSPPNPTVGAMMTNRLAYNFLLPKYRSGWFPVVPNGVYPITHGLDMSPNFPFGFTVFWSSTPNGDFPLINNNYDYGSVSVSYNNSTTITFYAGTRTANIPTVGYQYAGFWNICLY